MKKALAMLLLLGGGSGVGAASAWGVTLLREPEAPSETRLKNTDADLVFVPTGSILVPVTVADGTLTAYVTIECALHVGQDEAESVTARLPLLIHAINMRTFRSPLATGPDERLPDLARYRAIVQAEAGKVFGPGVVRRVAVTKIKQA